MSAIISASIDLSKIDKSKIFEKDGKKWLSISISINDETNYDNNVGISIAQSKEEREAKTPKMSMATAFIAPAQMAIALNSCWSCSKVMSRPISVL